MPSPLPTDPCSCYHAKVGLDLRAFRRLPRGPLPAAVLAVCLLLGAATPGWSEETLEYAGSTTIGMGILYAGGLKAFTARTGLTFRSIDTISGSSIGLAKLLAGEVNVAGAGRALTPEEKSRGLVEHRIAYDALALWVNRDNPVSRLTREQAKGIFTGGITNWKEAGGRDAPVALVLAPLEKSMATMEVLQKVLLDNRPFGAPAVTAEYAREQVVAVSQNPNAICAASYGFAPTFNQSLRDKVKMIELDGVLPASANILNGSYLISRPLILATRGIPAGKVKTFIDFMLSTEGQGIVGRNFVPVR
jgi:phosphate transport system substrate-binding protein